MSDKDKLEGKEKSQGLEWLWRQRFDNFHRRQSYEWKMVAVLWTPPTLYIGFGLRDTLMGAPLAMAVSASIIYLLIHMFWQANLRASNEAVLVSFQSNRPRSSSNVQT